MLRKWPIRVKLLVGLGLLVLVVGILCGSGLYATYAYRDLAKSLSWRVAELPVAAQLSRQVGDLRITLGELQGLRASPFLDAVPSTMTLSQHTACGQGEMPLRVRVVRDQFRDQLVRVEDTLARYREQLDHQLRTALQMADNQAERETVRKIEAALCRVHQANCDEDWMLDDVRVGRLDAELENLQSLAVELPSHLHEKLVGFSDEVRGQYRGLIVGTWVTALVAALIFALFVRLNWMWILRPLQVLIYGSRVVAAGQFDHRIHLDSDDEMAELAEAMNDMTDRFQAIRDDLDRQVQERTKQVVRSEQLASVGFLAAGVAHEINNPLASIAMCAESLQGRLAGMLQPDEQQHDLVEHYLQMIQDEAFRCKGITEQLLDFSRVGQATRQKVELGGLVQDVVGMVGHLGRYQGKCMEFDHVESVAAPVNVSEIKQVVLNLLTNALDSLDDRGDDQGLVKISLRRHDGLAELTVADNGGGISPEVLENVFEPFFTRRKAGQGTGLGLSISYRIIDDHGGQITAESPGIGLGATFTVRLPLKAAAGHAPGRLCRAA